MPVFPFWLLNLVAAACGMRLLPFACATVLGIIPGTFVYAAVGAGLANVLADGGTPNFAAIFSPRILLPLLALAALTLLPVGWRALKGRRAGGGADACRATQKVDAKGRGAQGGDARGGDAGDGDA